MPSYVLGTGNGVTDDTASIQSLFERPRVGQVLLPYGSYRITAPLRPPPGVSLIGDGPFASVIVPDAGCDAFVLDGTTDVAKQGVFANFGIRSGGGSPPPGFTGGVGMRVSRRQHLTLANVWINGMAGGALALDTTYCVSLRDCLFQGSGGPVAPAVSVNRSTCFGWSQCRISGAGSNAYAGLRIDRTSPFTVRGGNIESSGVLLAIASRQEDKTPTGPGVVEAVDLECPSGCYAALGEGWNGQWSGVRRVAFRNCNAVPSDALIQSGFIFFNSESCRVEGCNIGVAAGGTQIDLHGSNNHRFSTGPNMAPDAGRFFLINNGQPVAAATPGGAWLQAD